MRSFLEDLSLKRRITLSVALGLAFILAVFGYMTMWAVQQSTDQIYHEREALARSTARYVDALMLRLQREVEDAASLASQVTTLRARSELIAAHRSDVFNRLLLANYHGDVTWQTPSDNPLANVSSWPCVQRSGLTFQPATTSLLVDTGGAPAGCIAYPLSDNSGMLVAELNLRSQEFGVLPADDGEQGLIIDVVDDGGAVLTSSHASTTWVDHMFVLGPLIDANLSGVRAHEMPGGSSRPSHLVAYAPLISVSQWGITVEQSQDIALALPGSLGWRIMLIGAIMLLLGSVVAGQLSAAFASMTRNLVRARDELVSRNQELSALSSIAATVGQSLELDEVMGKALQRVLEVTRTEAGCVFLADTENRRLTMVTRIGSWKRFDCRQSGAAAANCACHQVLRHGHTLMVNDVCQCPALSDDATTKGLITSFVAAPLKSKERVLAVMNLVCSSQSSFTEHDFRLLDSIGYHVGLAIENSMLYQNSRQTEELRGHLLTSIINAQEEERRRVSRELHDGCGQILTGLILRIESAASTVSLEGSPLSEKLADIRLIAVQALDDTRKVMGDLRSPVLEDLGLVAGIRSYAETSLGAAGVQVDFEAEGLGQRLLPFAETAVFRIMQEAVRNIIKHAEARSAKLRLKAEDDGIIITVEDDGRGFDVGAVLSHVSSTQALGLLGMRERAKLLGGTLSVRSTPGQGTSVVVQVPIGTPPGW